MKGIRMWRWAVLLALLPFATAVQAEGVEIGGPSPVDLLGTTPDGEDIRISEHRGKVLVVSFWASWCGYCQKQFPFLDYIQNAAGRENLRVVVVNFQEPVSDYRRVRHARRKSSVTWTHDASGELSDALGIESVPYMLIFDRAGELAGIRRGYSEEDAERTAEIINELLREPAPLAAAPAGSSGSAPPGREPGLSFDASAPPGG